MKIKSIILTIVLSFFYPFSFLSRVHSNRVTFISLEHDNLSKDFKLIYDQLEEYGQYELKTVLFKFEASLLGNIKYGFACIRQLFLIENSRLVIIDYNNFVVSTFPHRKKVKVLQLWHATGALKKFGNEVKRDYVINHYDYSIVNSDFFKPIFAKAFNLPEKHVFVTGIPNNDKIHNPQFVTETKNRLLKKYPQLIGKKVVTYSPTFRGRISTQFKEASIDLEKLHQMLGEEYIVIYKAHPLISHSKYENNPNVLFIREELISLIFCVTDILITDYSAIAIDWMTFNKPIISYAPDLKRYARKPGFTFNYFSEFPGPIVNDVEGLAQAILSKEADENIKKRQKFSQKTNQYMDGQSTQRVVSLIHDIMSHQELDEWE